MLIGYEKAPSDKVFLISGIRKRPRVLIGKAGIRIPFFERKDILIAKQISVDIKTNGFIPTLDFIGVDVDAVRSAVHHVNGSAQRRKECFLSFKIFY